MHNVGIKIIVISALCAMFGMGLLLINGLVYERERYQEQVIDEIQTAHVGDQSLITPFLLIKENDRQRYVFAQNSTVNISSQVRDDEYQRGIYQAISYHATVDVKQHFDPKNAVVYTQSLSAVSSQPKSEHSDKPTDEQAPKYLGTQAVPVVTLRAETTEERALQTSNQKHTSKQASTNLPPQLRLIVPIEDLRGALPTKVSIDGKSYPLRVGTSQALTLDYLEAVLPFDEQAFFMDDSLDVALSLSVTGSESLGLIPTGDEVTMSLASNWSDPKFEGMLPIKKSISSDGFDATWYTHINADFQNRVFNAHPSLTQANSGTDDHTRSGDGMVTTFIRTNDTYTLTDRSIKYGLMIILVSFGTFFLFEVITRRAIHAMQYILVASALLVFYLLLLSLSEHMAFLQAYGIASIACVALIGWYAGYVLGSLWRGVGFGLFLGVLYVCFYLVLSATSYNLLLGSVFGFVCIAVAMFVTRHVDWYQIADTKLVHNQSNPTKLNQDTQKTPPINHSNTNNSENNS